MNERKNTIEVSVLIPNYNYGRYLEQCIKSVIDSDFDHNKLEILIVDDASSDNSIEIINKIKNTSSTPIKIIEKKKNSGLPKTRNEGIRNAKGKFLFFLDSDNFISADCLSKHFEFLNQNKEYSGCYASIQRFDDVTGEEIGLLSDKPFNFELLCKGNYIDAMAMLRKDDLLEVGLYDENLSYKGLEDYELWLRMGIKNKKIHFIQDHVLSYYRVHKGSMINSLSLKEQDKMISYIKNKLSITENESGKPKILEPVIQSQCSVLLQSLDNVKVQVFWSDKSCNFSEEDSLFQYIRLENQSKKVDFELDLGEKEIAYVRFDLADQLCVLNIHDIIIETVDGQKLWRWNPNEIVYKNEVVLIEDEKLFQGKTIQVSLNHDPFFYVPFQNNSHKKLIIKIELSAIDDAQKQSVFQNQTPPLSFFTPEIVADKANEFKQAEEKLNQIIQVIDNKILDLKNENTGVTRILEENKKLIDHNNAVLIDNAEIINKIRLEKENLQKANATLILNVELKEKELLSEKIKGEKFLEEKNKLVNYQEELNKQNKELVQLKTSLEKDLSHEKEILDKLRSEIRQVSLEKEGLEEQIKNFINQNNQLIQTNSNQHNFIVSMENEENLLRQANKKLMGEMDQQNEKIKEFLLNKATCESKNEMLLSDLREAEKKIAFFTKQYEDKNIVGIALNKIFKNKKQS